MKTTGWRTIKIFISSTFSDMHSERDVIRKLVIPRLNDALLKHGITVMATDLRWGVDTVGLDEETRETKVLRVCMDAITNSRPFFVALIGDRYGWVPSKDRIDRFRHSISDDDSSLIPDGISPRSVTEMEIILGALGTEERLSHSFFCFRNADSYEAMDEETLKKFVDAVSDNPSVRDNVHKLGSLKHRIMEACDDNEDRIIHYSGTWDSVSRRFTALETFANDLYERLLNDILADQEKIVETNGLNGEAQCLRRFIEANTANFCGRRTLLSRLTDYVINHREPESVLRDGLGLVLTGRSGCGKSYLFSALCSRLEAVSDEKRLLVLAHAAGITPASVSVEQMVKRWIDQMTEVLGENFCREKAEQWLKRKASRIDEYPKDKNEDRAQLVFLAMCLQARGIYPVMLVDSIDSLDEPDTLFSFIPFNVPFICTSIPDCIDKDTLSDRYTIIDADSFGRDDAISLIEATFRRNDKEVWPELTEALLSVGGDIPSYSSPLWLKIALTILLEIGSEDFREINDVEADADDLKISSYLTRIAKGFPVTSDDLFRYFIDFSTRFFNRELVVDTLCYIALAQYGINERYLAKRLGDNWNQLEFESLRLWLRDFLVKSQDSDRWMLNHNVLRRVLMLDSRKDYRKLFLDMLASEVKLNDRLLDEFIFQLISLDSPDYLAKFISEYIERGECVPSYQISVSILNATENLGFDKTIGFIRSYIADNYRSDCEWLEVLIALNKTYPVETLLDVYSNLISSISKDDILKGDPELVSMVFSRYEYYTYNLRELNKFKAFSSMADAIELYLELKQKHGAAFLSFWLRHSIYMTWGEYLFGLADNCSDIEIITAEEDRFLSELEWYFDNVKDIYDPWQSFCLCCNYFFIEINRSHHRHLVRIFSYFLSLCPKEDEYKLGLYKETQEKYFSKYGDSLLREALEHKVRTDTTPVTTEVYRIDESSTDRPAFLAKKNPQRELNIKLQIEINTYLASIPGIVRENFDSSCRAYTVDNLLRHLLSCAGTYLGAIPDRSHFPDLGIAGMLPIVFRLEYRNNYGIHMQDLKECMEIYRCSTEYSQKGSITGLLEGLIENLWHCFYHNFRSDNALEWVQMLAEAYKEEGRIDDFTDLYEKAFDLAASGYIEDCYDIFFNSYSSLCDVEPYYWTLMEVYARTGEIEGAVKRIARWLDLCDIACTDRRDVKPCSEYYERSYSYLGKLYDGTSALTDAVRLHAPRFLSDRLLPVRFEGKWGYIDMNGRTVIPCRYRWASRAGGKYLAVYDGKYMAYIDYDGNPVTQFVFDEIMTMTGDLGWVKKNGRYSIFNSGKLTPVDYRFGFAGSFYNGNLKIEFSGKDYPTNLIKPDGHTTIFEKAQPGFFITEDGGLIITHSFDAHLSDEEGRYQAFLWDSDGKLIRKESRISPFGNAFATPFRALNSENRGYINRRGEHITDLKYRYARPMFENMAAVAVEHPECLGRVIWGFIDSEGHEIVRPQYDEVGNFHCGLAWVCYTSPVNKGTGFGRRDSKFGFIDTTGKLVVPMIYDDVMSFRDGVATVWLGDKTLQINTLGVQLSSEIAR